MNPGRETDKNLIMADQLLSIDARLELAREQNTLPEFMAWARKHASDQEIHQILWSGLADFYTIIYLWDAEKCELDLADAFEYADPYVGGLHKHPNFTKLISKHMLDILNECPRTCWKLVEIPRVGRTIGKEILSIIASRPFERSRKQIINGVLALDTSMENYPMGGIDEDDPPAVLLYPRAHKLFHREIAKLCTPRQLCLLVRNVATLCFEQNPSELKTRTCAVLRAAGQIS
jgi:hypothetical protein